MTRPGARLTERDVTLLTAIGELRVLTTAQVHRLLFSSEQTTLRRLRRLEAEGFVRCLRTSAVPHRLVTLTTRGAIAAGCTGNGNGAYSPMFLEHVLGANDFWIALVQACATSDTELTGFLTDIAVAGGQPGVQPKRILSESLGVAGAHVPDGAFGLRRGDRSALFFFELDRGTEVIGNRARGLGRIITSYLQALTSQGYRKLAGPLGVTEALRGFRVLIVTSSETRVANVRRLWGAVGREQSLSRFIWLAPSTVLSNGNILRAPWLSLDSADPRTYAIGGE